VTAATADASARPTRTDWRHVAPASHAGSTRRGMLRPASPPRWRLDDPLQPLSSPIEAAGFVFHDHETMFARVQEQPNPRRATERASAELTSMSRPSSRWSRCSRRRAATIAPACGTLDSTSRIAGGATPTRGATITRWESSTISARRPVTVAPAPADHDAPDLEERSCLSMATSRSEAPRRRCIALRRQARRVARIGRRG